MSGAGGDVELFGESPGRVPAATIAAQRVAEVRDRPLGRLDLLRSSYAPPPGAAPLHLPFPRAALAFMGWQLRRGLLNPLDHERPGSPWWRAVNERLLRDTCEARSRLLGHPGPASSPSVDPSIRFARQPSPRTWYLAHNVTIVRAYLDHRELAEQENRVERFFINLILVRVLYAHALVAAPRLALAWLAPVGRWLGDPRLDLTGMFLSVSRVLPHRYPLQGELDDYIAAEHAFGRLLDVASSCRASPSCTAGRPTSCGSQTSPTWCATPPRPMRGIRTTANPGRRRPNDSSAPCAGLSRSSMRCECMGRMDARAGDWQHRGVVGDRGWSDGGVDIRFLRAAAETDGALLELETTVPPGVKGPPLHLHLAERESFRVIDGELAIRAGRDWQLYQAGEGVVVEPGTPHTFANRSDHATRFVVVIEPPDPFETMIRLRLQSRRMPLLKLAAIHHGDTATLMLAGFPVRPQRMVWNGLAGLARILRR